MSAVVVGEEGEEDAVVAALVRARLRVEVAAAEDEDAQVPGAAGVAQGHERGDVAAARRRQPVLERRELPCRRVLSEVAVFFFPQHVAVVEVLLVGRPEVLGQPGALDAAAAEEDAVRPEAHRRVAQKAGGLLSNFMSPTKSRDSANE